MVRSKLVWPRLLRGVHSTVDAYCTGMWDSPDLAATIRIAARNVGLFDSVRRSVAFVRAPWLRTRSGFRRNTPASSRKDVEAHYDLGNEMFSRMLDPAMMYSCAVFEHPESTFHQAQLCKLEMVCEKLDLGRHDRVVEIGTGWGGFAVYAATTRGCHVTTTTISREQHDLAIERVRDAGLGHLVDVRMDDYRELRGSYDKLVSLEMIEAVGHKDLGTFFACCSNMLAPDGAMLLQAITIDDRIYDVGKLSRELHPDLDLSQRLPSLPAGDRRRRGPALGHAHRHLEDFTHHYGETLRRWRANFDAAAHRARPARLRRGLPQAVAGLPVVLRGRVRGATHRPGSNCPRQAPPQHGSSRPGLAAGSRAAKQSGARWNLSEYGRTTASPRLEPQMNVCVVGSGISGLSSAFYLLQYADVGVTVYEQAGVFGGRANVTDDGEHCARVFLSDYDYLFGILALLTQVWMGSEPAGGSGWLRG